MQPPGVHLLLGERENLDMSHVSKILATRHPGAPSAIPDSEPGRSTAQVFNFAGSVFALMQFDLRLPDGWQAAASRASMHWRDAHAKFERHRGHLNLSVMGEPHDRLQAARALTAVAGALIESCPSCSGVLWDLTVANSSEEFSNRARQALAPYPDYPSALWVSLQPFRDPEPSRIGVVTCGLMKFVGREIELEGTGAQLTSLLGTARGLVTYLLQPGITVRDGDTIGHSAAEHIQLRVIESQRFKGLPVFSARLPAA
jgi:hypothetical protein